MKKTPTLRGIFLLFIFWLSLPVGYAKHIIGGVMTYECLGNGTYEFTMKIYRDCEGQGAEFDRAASIGIYTSRNNASYSFFDSLSVPITSASNIDPPVFPCLTIPPGICAQEGIYIWRFTLPANLSDRTFTFAYQRCCRNEAILNIINPDDAGATFTIDITPTSRQLCNDSPRFATFPPTVICNAVPIEYDHAAIDNDGDQLVYELCAPFLGGGNDISFSGQHTCIGVSPQPACIPPYEPVPFTIPTYTALNPMGGSPPITIDANTGLITGTPNVQGRFVVGVCVKEYRNGILLSTIRRDFQFNVVNCQPTVIAKVAADSLDPTNRYVINLCGDSVVNFQNLSTLEQNIFSYEWSFSDPAIASSTLRDPTVTFPGLGSYNASMIVNKGTVCADTALIDINVFPDITADFTFAYDTCVAGPVQFTDASFSGSGTITNWNWVVEPSVTLTAENPTHLYTTPGIKNVSLEVIDINRCKETKTIPLTYYPAPREIIIAPDNQVGCEPLPVFFNNLSLPIDDTYTLEWNFGDGQSSSAISPTHTYSEGIYDVSVAITSPIGCAIAETYPALIEAKGSPLANFTFTPTELSNFQKTAQFTNLSENEIAWRWLFQGRFTNNLENPTYTFSDTGVHEVRLVVFHESGCTDTLIQYLDVIPRVTYFLPNAFTPNSDGKNDGFRGAGETEGMRDFVLQIWNRWGELVFETKDPFESWNGQKNNNGQDAPNGVYVVIVEYVTPRNEKKSLKGFCTLLR